MSVHTDVAHRALLRLREQLPRVSAAIVTGIPNRPRIVSTAALARQAAAARADRQERVELARRGLAPIGASRTPANLLALDVLRDTEQELAELEDAVCERVAPELRPAASTGARITRLLDLLPKLHDDLARHVSAETVRMSRRAAWLLGDTTPIHKLDARCPLCDCRSLRVLLDRMVVVCINPACTCHDDLCGCRNESGRTRHQWGEGYWPHLARQLAAQDQEEAA